MDVSDVVEGFGGTGEMARLLGVLPSAVSNWKAAGRIPPRWHYRLSRLAHERGIVIDENLFEEMDSPPAATGAGAA